MLAGRSASRYDQVSIHAPARGATWAAASVHDHARGFNPRPRAGGDCLRLLRWRGVASFQSTPPRGGRPQLGRPGCAEPLVSIHAPARGATQGLPGIGQRFAGFNPRPRAGGDAAEPHAVQAATWSFNPRPRAGGDAVPRMLARPARRVSIHAPARGATHCPAGAPKRPVRVSIHAPARGATSRRPEPTGEVAVSIHAPAWGATRALAGGSL